MITTIIVQNLKCGRCAKTIISEILEVGNVFDVLVDLELAVVSFLYKNINDARVGKDKLKALSYASIDSKNTVAAKAFSFVSCATGKMSKS